MPGRKPKPARKQRRIPDALSERVGARVRELRQGLSLKFVEFVAETELAQGVVSEIERGLVLPRLSTLERIATALEVTVADLVIGDSLREKIFDATRGLSDADLVTVQSTIQAMKKAETK